MRPMGREEKKKRKKSVVKSLLRRSEGSDIYMLLICDDY